MTCPHINKASTQLSILISNINGGIHKEIGSFLTTEKVRNFMGNRWTNPEAWELDQISEKHYAIDEKILKDRLEGISKILSQCKCFSESAEKLKEEIEERNEERNDKQLILSSVNKRNEYLQEKLVNTRKENAKTKLDLKEEKLTNLVEKLENEGIEIDNVFELETLYGLLVTHNKNKDRVQTDKTKKEIVNVKGQLQRKGLKYGDINSISSICEEIAKLKLEVEIGEELQERQYQAIIETPLNIPGSYRF